MTTTVFPAAAAQWTDRIAAAVRTGLASFPKRLPPWLFYDEAGSKLFDEITETPEYYLTRTERSIFAEHADEIVSRAAADDTLRVTELGAGSADKTRLLLTAAVRQQGPVIYEPVDVSFGALAAAQARIESEFADVLFAPQLLDYADRLQLEPCSRGERRLVLYIGSSIGNFEPDDAARLLQRVRAGLRRGDALLLGVDLVKSPDLLLAAYDDAAGVTAAFNLNLLVRLNRELGADFNVAGFTHHVTWNAKASRMEIYLVSRVPQTVCLPALDMTVEFARSECIHTENSYKYRPLQVEALLTEAGFAPEASWTDRRGWFAVHLARTE
jgi:dimethylhistidine N-methyltransferase